jgi:hypothetical protein
LIHKHHHRQHYPTGGYLDAGNEHPIEHWVVVLSTWYVYLGGGTCGGAWSNGGAWRDAVFVFQHSCRPAAMLNHYDAVQFSINSPYSELQQSMQTASMDIHTMRQEHFGIGIVEVMAAGLLTIAHNSGGPKTWGNEILGHHG